MKKYMIIAIMAIGMGSTTSYAQHQVPTKKAENVQKKNLEEKQDKATDNNRMDRKVDKVDKKERKMHKKQRKVNAEKRAQNEQAK